MPVERLGNGVAVVRLAALDERCGADGDSRNAEPALHAALEDERLGNRRARRLRQALQRDDVVAGHLFWLTQT